MTPLYVVAETWGLLDFREVRGPYATIIDAVHGAATLKMPPIDAGGEELTRDTWISAQMGMVAAFDGPNEAHAWLSAVAPCCSVPDENRPGRTRAMLNHEGGFGPVYCGPVVHVLRHQMGRATQVIVEVREVHHGAGVLNFHKLTEMVRPFRHWIADDFIEAGVVEAINREWPQDMAVETGVATALKGARLFPDRLPPYAQALAEELYSIESRQRLSALLGIELLPDPWLYDGPDRPRLGGGLHEILPGGMLGVHVDFEAHPAGLRRVANLLIYLNTDWRDEWGGALELHDSAGAVSVIPPRGGRAVLFRTTADSYHGHPHPLACPAGRTRRSLALYYYAESSDPMQRPKTVYRRKRP